MITLKNRIKEYGVLLSGFSETSYYTAGCILHYRSRGFRVKRWSEIVFTDIQIRNRLMLLFLLSDLPQRKLDLADLVKHPEQEHHQNLLHSISRGYETTFLPIQLTNRNLSKIDNWNEYCLGRSYLNFATPNERQQQNALQRKKSTHSQLPLSVRVVALLVLTPDACPILSHVFLGDADSQVGIESCLPLKAIQYRTLIPALKHLEMQWKANEIVIRKIALRNIENSVIRITHSNSLQSEILQIVHNVASTCTRTFQGQTRLPTMDERTDIYFMVRAMSMLSLHRLLYPNETSPSLTSDTLEEVLCACATHLYECESLGLYDKSMFSLTIHIFEALMILRRAIIALSKTDSLTERESFLIKRISEVITKKITDLQKEFNSGDPTLEECVEYSQYVNICFSEGSPKLSKIALIIFDRLRLTYKSAQLRVKERELNTEKKDPNKDNFIEFVKLHGLILHVYYQRILLDAFEETGCTKYLDEALTLGNVIDDVFFFTAASVKKFLPNIRAKGYYCDLAVRERMFFPVVQHCDDINQPCAVAVLLQNLHRLNHMRHPLKSEYRAKLNTSLSHIVPIIKKNPEKYLQLIHCALLCSKSPFLVIVANKGNTHEGLRNIIDAIPTNRLSIIIRNTNPSHPDFLHPFAMHPVFRNITMSSSNFVVCIGDTAVAHCDSISELEDALRKERNM